MAQRIKFRRSSVAGRVPTTSSLSLGELAFNTADGKVFFQRGDDTIQSIFTTNALTTGSLLLSGSASITGSVNVTDTIYANDIIRTYTGFEAYRAGSRRVFIGGTGTNGQLLLDSNGTWDVNLTGGTDKYFRLGNFGIGTTSPAYTLDVLGDSRVTGDLRIESEFPRIYLTDTNHSSDYILFNANGSFALYDESNAKYRIHVRNSGNVGIGTTTAAYTLDVNGDGRFTDSLTVTGSLNVSGSINHDGDLTVTGVVTAQEFRTEFVSASIIYQSGSTKFGDTSDDTHSFTGSLEVTSGDTSVSKISINGERNSYLKIQDSGSRYSLIQRRSDLTEGQLRILQNGSTKFIFTDGGYLGINTASVPNRALEVEGEIRSTSGSYFATADGNVGIGTTVPTRKLHVEGSSYLKLANNSFLDFTTPLNTQWWITDNDAKFTMYLQASRTGTYRLRTGDNAKSTYFIQNRSGSLFARGGATYPDIAPGSALLELRSTTEGLLIPRTDATSNISTPAQGLLTYLTSSANEGIYYYNSGSYQGWTRVLNDSGSQVISGSLVVSESIATPSLAIEDYITHTGDPDSYFGFANNDSFVIYTAGNRMITSGDNAVVINELQADKNFVVRTNNSNSTLFVDGGTDRVGIGTTTPSQKLTVEGAISASGQVTANYFYGTAGGWFRGSQFLEAGNVHTLRVGYGSAGQFQLQTGNGAYDVLRATNTGLVGIGTTSPTAKLDIVGDTKITGSLGISGSVVIDTPSTLPLVFKRSGIENGRIFQGGGDLYIGTGDTNIRFNDNIDALVPANSNQSDRDNAISLGYAASRFSNAYLAGLDVSGSTSFDGDLVVTGSLTVSGSSTFTNIGPAVFSGSATFNEGIISSRVASLENTNNYISLAGGGGSFIDFRANNSAIARMSSTGMFIGGDTSPSAKLHIYEAGTTAGFLLESSGSSASRDVFKVNALGPNSDNTRLFQVQTNGTSVFETRGNGLTVFGGNYADRVTSNPQVSVIGTRSVTLGLRNDVGYNSSNPRTILQLYTDSNESVATFDDHGRLVLQRRGNSAPADGNNDRLLVSGSGRFTEGLTVSGSLTASFDSTSDQFVHIRNEYVSESFLGGNVGIEFGYGNFGSTRLVSEKTGDFTPDTFSSDSQFKIQQFFNGSYLDILTAKQRGGINVGVHTSNQSGIRVLRSTGNSSNTPLLYLSSNDGDAFDSYLTLNATSDSNATIDFDDQGIFRLRSTVGTGKAIGASGTKDNITILPSTDTIVIGDNLITSGSAEIRGGLTVTGSINHDGDLTVTGTVTAQEFKTEFVSASIIYRSGSTKFGDTSDDQHSFTGSVEISGSLFSNKTYLGTTTTHANDATNDVTINGILSLDDTYLRVKGINVVNLASNGWTFTSQITPVAIGYKGYSTQDFTLRTGNAAYNLDLGLAGQTNIRIQSGSGNVGINTLAPEEKLSVGDGNIQLENNHQITWSDIGDGNSGRVYIRGNEDNDWIQFTVDNNNAKTMRWDTTGLGLGTVSPSEKLHIKDGDILIDNAGTVSQDANLTLKSHANGESRIIFRDQDGTSGSLEYINQGASDRFRFGVSGSAEALTITKDGNVGIGTQTPPERLTVQGNISGSGNLYIDGSITGSALQVADINYPTADGTLNQAIVTDGAGNLSFQDVQASTALNTTVVIKNVSGGTIYKGTPLYVTGSGTSGNLVGVWPADASRLDRMPALAIASEDILDGAESVGLLDGFIGGVDTSAFASGDEVFVAVGGGYTNVAPTGSGVYIQKLGNVEKVHPTNGSGVINGPNTFRALPNWETGKVMVGTDIYPVTSSVIHLDEANGRLGVGTTSPQQKLHVDGTIRIGADVDLGRYGGRLYTAQDIVLGTLNAEGANITVNASNKNVIGVRRPSSGTVSALKVRNYSTQDKYVDIDTDGNAFFAGSGSFANNLTVTGSLTVSGSSTFTNIGPAVFSGSLTVESGNDVLVDEGTLFVQASTNRVGIGTQAPTEKLQVAGNVLATGGTITAYASNTSKAIISNVSGGGRLQLLSDNGDIYLRTKGGDSYFNAGNVGIGTSVPSASLHISASSSDTAFRITQPYTTNTNPDYIGEITLANTARGGLKVEGKGETTNNNVPLLLYGNDTAGGAGARVVIKGNTDASNRNIMSVRNSADTELLVVRGAGNVGIGTTSPSLKLDVSGTGRISSTTYLATNAGNVGIGTTSPLQKLHLKDGTDVNLQVGAVSSELQLKATNDADSAYIPMILRASEFNILSGNVGIGKNNPSYTLDITGTARIEGGDFSVDGNRSIYFGPSGTQGRLRMSGNFAAYSDTGFGWYTDGELSTPSMFLSASGDIGIGKTPTYTLDVSGSGNFTDGLIVTGSILHDGDLTVTGTVTAQEFKTEFVSASIIYRSGSTKFGDTADDTHSFTGSIFTAGDTTLGNSDSNLTTVRGNLVVDRPTAGGYISIETNNPTLRLNDVNDLATIASNNGNITLSADQNSTGNKPDIRFNIRLNEYARLDQTGFGIGTDAPQAKLDVRGSAHLHGTLTVTGSSPLIYLKDTTLDTVHLISSNNTELQIKGDQAIEMFANNTSSLYIASDGDVGIGTDTPQANFNVYSANTAQIRIDAYTDDALLTLDSGKDGSTETSYVYFKDNNVNKWLIGKDTGNDFLIYDTTVGQAKLEIKDSGDMYLMQSGGNVGIGTTSPTAQLHISSSGTPLKMERAGYDTYGFIQSTGTGLQVQNFTDNRTDMFFKGDGTVGIGTTTPSYKLHVSSSNNNDGIAVHYPANNSLQFPFYVGNSTLGTYARLNNQIFEFKRNGGASTIKTVGSSNNLALQSANDIVFNTNGANERVIITDTGNVGIGTTTPGQKLHVAGTVRIVGTNSFDLYSDGTGMRFDLNSGIRGFQFENNSGSLFALDGTGAARLNQYGQGNITGTAAYTLGVDSSGNIIEIAQGNTGENTDVDTGTGVIDTFPSSSASSTFTNYVVQDGTNFRAGQLMSVWDSSGNIQYSDVTTNDIGDTSGVSLFVEINGADIEVKATVPSDNWSVKTNTTLL